MFVLKKDRIAVYTYLFNEGVIVAQKDFYKAKHSDELDVHNNVVIQLMKGLHSMGPPPDPTEKNPEIRRYVKQTYAWQHYYWYLTEDGLEYLRNYLHIPKDVVPKTRQTRQASRPARPERGDDRYGDRGDRGDRGFGREKRVEGGFGRPEFSRDGERGGFGRGGFGRGRDGFRGEGGARGGFGGSD
mmetsp:Transcript_5504/g.15367  ORF Transcript_5504/g.15367 Transcript_5504/m.15367 type:complete len:186 (-) Transcript_5504:194-751(-)